MPPPKTQLLSHYPIYQLLTILSYPEYQKNGPLAFNRGVVDFNKKKRSSGLVGTNIEKQGTTVTKKKIKEKLYKEFKKEGNKYKTKCDIRIPTSIR